MIGRDMRVAREKSLPILEGVKSAKNDKNEAKAKEDAQCQDRFRVRMNHGKERAHQWMIRKR